MAPRALKLGTRRSALARAQSAAVARQLEQLHPGLEIELVGIDTRGDRILDRPLSTVDGKEFFTAEIDAALLAGGVDFTVHSYKDLSLERSARLTLAAVPAREQPRDLVLFAPDARACCAAGETLRIGSSSPRRASFVPPFLRFGLPPRADGEPARIELVELRGNVDSRVRRLHEPRGSARQLDGVILAFAGLARLWADAASHGVLRELLAPLPRMVLPLSACPAAPAQGALALECRTDDAATLALLSAIDHAPTRQAVEIERALLAQRGGGCHQRFGATQIDVPGLGALLYTRVGDEAATAGEAATIGAAELRWTPQCALEHAPQSIVAWDGSRVERLGAVPLESGATRARGCLAKTESLFVSHQRALPPDCAALIPTATHVWVPGLSTWQALAARGVWVEGCGDSLGFAALAPLLAEPLLDLPPLSRWTVLTHADAVTGWSEGEVIATYQHADVGAAEGAADLSQATHLYWHSSAQFERWRAHARADAHHACGPGKTFAHLQRAGVQRLTMFPHVAQWREWLGL